MTPPALQAHSARLKRIKLICGGIALLLLSLLLLNPLFSFETSKITLSALQAKNDLEGTYTPVVTNPVLHGLDKSGKPYDIRANSAVQMKDNHIRLFKVIGDLDDLSTTRKIHIVSEYGDIFPKNHLLTLHDSVHLTTSDGYEIKTSLAHIHLKDSITYGDKPIFLQASGKMLEARGFRVQDNGMQISFSGPLTMTISNIAE